MAGLRSEGGVGATVAGFARKWRGFLRRAGLPAAVDGFVGTVIG